MARRITPVHTARQYDALTARQRATYARTLKARGYMRGGYSLRDAAEKAGTSPSTVKRYAGSDLSKVEGRHRVIRDRAYRPMRLITNTGVEKINASRREATLLSRYRRAVGEYDKTRDPLVLQPFAGQAAGGFELETGPDVIDELAARGELDDYLKDLYALSERARTP